MINTRLWISNKIPKAKTILELLTGKGEEGGEENCEKETGFVKTKVRIRRSRRRGVSVGGTENLCPGCRVKLTKSVDRSQVWGYRPGHKRKRGE